MAFLRLTGRGEHRRSQSCPGRDVHAGRNPVHVDGPGTSDPAAAGPRRPRAVVNRRRIDFRCRRQGIESAPSTSSTAAHGPGGHSSIGMITPSNSNLGISRPQRHEPGQATPRKAGQPRSSVKPRPVQKVVLEHAWVRSNGAFISAKGTDGGSWRSRDLRPRGRPRQVPRRARQAAGPRPRRHPRPADRRALRPLP